MTTPDESRLFIAELHPGLGAYLAGRLSDGYDANAGRGRFQVWLSEHADADRRVGEYLARIGTIPPLSTEEETELAALARAGQDALRQFTSAGDSLTPEARDNLRRVVGKGAVARSRLLAANTNVVVGIARRYSDRGLPLWDLIQAGNEGLRLAAEKYDPAKGYRFGAFATWWIRQAITRALPAVPPGPGTGPVPAGPVPASPGAAGSGAAAPGAGDGLTQAERQLLQSLGRPPSPEELAADLDPFPNGTAR
jgi:RNA polymerase primary sigma factor